jgi:hypothetical protein
LIQGEETAAARAAEFLAPCGEAIGGIGKSAVINHSRANKRTMPTCEGEVGMYVSVFSFGTTFLILSSVELPEANVVYYKSLAYHANPSHPRHIELIAKMEEDDPFLTEQELQVRSAALLSCA